MGLAGWRRAKVLVTWGFQSKVPLFLLAFRATDMVKVLKIQIG